MAQFRLLQSAMEQFKAQDPEGRYDVEWNGDGTAQTRHREELAFENVALAQRSYK